MSINLDTASPQVSDSIKDLAAALFRSASIAKRNLIARGRVSKISSFLIYQKFQSKCIFDIVMFRICVSVLKCSKYHTVDWTHID